MISLFFKKKSPLCWVVFFAIALNPLRSQADERLIEILSLLETQRVVGIQKLQQLFATTQNESEKFDAALLLSSLPTDTLGNETQSQFLEYLNSVARLKNENGETLSRIFRKLGDVRYDLGKLKEARESYLNLKKINNPMDTEYASYRLGWIEVNEKNPVAALDSWMSIFELSKNKNRSSFLGNLIFRDLGRVWPEVVANGVTRFDSKIAELILEPQSREEFLFGLKLGVRYISSRSPQDLENFRLKVREGILSLVVLEGVAASEKLILSGPCSILDWFPIGLQAQSLDSPLVFESLVRCYRSPGGGNLKKELQSSFEAIALIGRNRLPLAEIYFDQNQYSKSCLQYSEASKEDPALAGIVGSVARACEKSVLAAKNLNLPLEQRQGDLKRIFESFMAQAPKPLRGFESGQWVEILEILLSSEAKNLIAELDSTSRQKILENYLPAEGVLADEKAEKRRIWIWTEFLSREVDEIDPSGKLFIKFFDTLKWSSPVDAFGLAGLALKKGRPDWIWKHRLEFRAALKNQPGFASILSEVSNQALRKVLGERSNSNLTFEFSGTEIETVLKIVANIESGKGVLSQRSSFSSLPEDVLVSDWAKDFKKLESLEQNSSRYLGLALNPLSDKFVAALTGLVKKSQNLVSFVSEGPWFHKRMATIATTIVSSHQKQAAKKIKSIVAPKVLREPEKMAFTQEMAKIASELETLSETVRGPQSENTKNSKIKIQPGSLSDEKPRVIDMGQDNVESTVRQPGLKVIESDSTILKFLPQIYKSQFENLEKELTQPEIKIDGGNTR